MSDGESIPGRVSLGLMGYFGEGQVDPVPSKSNPGAQGSFLEGVTLPDEPILLMVNLVLQTAFLKLQCKPISLLLLGRPGIGKSRLLSPLSKQDFVSYVNDITRARYMW